MAAREKINGGAGFNQHESLRRFVNGQKTGDGLLDAVIKNMKIFALQAFRELSRRIGNEDADVYAIDADADGQRLLRSLGLLRGNPGLRGGLFLSLNTWGHNKNQGEEKKNKRAERKLIPDYSIH